MKMINLAFDKFITISNHIHPFIHFNDEPDYSHLLHDVSMGFNNDILVTSLQILMDYQDSTSSVTWYICLKNDKIKYDFKSGSKYNITFKFGDDFEFKVPDMQYYDTHIPSFSNDFSSLKSLNDIYDKIFIFLTESENKFVRVSIEEVDTNE